MGKKRGGGGAAGKNSVLNGRALFQYNPDLFKEGDGGDAEEPTLNGDGTGPTQANNEEEKEGDGDDQIKESKQPQVDETLFQGQEDADEDVDFD